MGQHNFTTTLTGVVADNAIRCGFHAADGCCSITVLTPGWDAFADDQWRGLWRLYQPRVKAVLS
jgi:hypothetical protein